MTKAGAYIKSVCFISSNLPHADTYAACASTGMKLFVIDSTITQNEIFRLAKVVYGVGNWDIIQVDGVKEGSDWFYYSYGKSPAWTGLKWQTSAAQAIGGLAVTDYYGAYNVDGFTCDGGCYYACELQK